MDPRLKHCAIRVACDVTNPLIGEQGASRIFGPQKGATEALIVELDNNLAHYASVIKKIAARGGEKMSPAPERRGNGGRANGFSGG